MLIHSRTWFDGVTVKVPAGGRDGRWFVAPTAPRTTACAPAPAGGS